MNEPSEPHSQESPLGQQPYSIPPAEPPTAPAPAASPAASAPAETPAARPGRRRLVVALVALHVVSALAAVLLLARSQQRQGSGGGDGVASAAGRLKLLAKREDVVGWLPIHGVIRESESGRQWDHGSELWARRLRSLADKSEVKAIVLAINSPGGTVGAVQELHQAIQRVRKEKKKPVVALLGDIAASGGYYLAVGCDKVVAHPGTLVGSIGVIFNMMNVEKLFEKVGVRSDPVKSGKHKDIGSATRPMTPEEKVILQGLIDNAYGQFLGAVMEGRGLPDAEARPLADGRIFTGAQAKDLKLVDQIGDSRDAIALAGQLGGISGTPKVLREGESLESILGMLEFASASWLRPETRLLQGLRDAAPTLEYRWTGF